MELRWTSLAFRTLGELAEWPLYDLVRQKGSSGLALQRLAHGIDTSHIEGQHRRRAISQEHTFAQDIDDAAVLSDRVQQQVAQVSQELQRKNSYARVVKLKLRYADFATLTRQVTLPHPTDQMEILRQAALRLFEETWEATRTIRLIGVGVQGLQTTRQLTFWNEQPPCVNDHPITHSPP
jgi:DNA polymerase IV